MTKNVFYIYAGENGFMESPIKIPGATNVVEKVRLIADNGKILTNGSERRTVVVTTKEGIKNWTEVNA